MIGPVKGVRVLVALRPVDFRKGAQGLAALVQGEIKAGKSVDEAAAEYKVPDKYPGYTVGTFFGGIKGNAACRSDTGAFAGPNSPTIP